MVADQTLDRLATHQVRDEGTHVAALGDVAGVAEAVHQLRPRACGAAGVPAELGRLAGESVTGQGRQHQVEGVLGVPPWAVGSVSGPTVSSSSMTEPGQPCVMISGKGVLVLRAHVDEVDLDPVDLGRELRKRVQPVLDPSEVVVRHPVAGELLQRLELDALRAVFDQFLAGPARRLDPPAHVVDSLLGNLDVEGPDLGGVR